MSEQHTSPCAACPFSRNVEPGDLGGSGPEVYIGQAFAGFVIPCHQTINYDDPNWKQTCFQSAKQCAGSAIFRANCEVQVHPLLRKGLLSLPVNTEKVFATPAQFLAHHGKIPLAVAVHVLQIITPEDLAEVVRQAAGVQIRLLHTEK